MKTEYKILWIDDDHDRVRGDKRSIKAFLDDYGIELIVDEIEVTDDRCPTQLASFSEAISDIDLDMVFIDFNMPEKGDKIISHIRKTLHHYHLPILFYTGEDEPEKILPKIFTESLLADPSFLNISDGIYFCVRDHIFDKSKLILTSLLTKEKKPQRVRGLLMDKVSEIDAKIMQSFAPLWPRVPDEHRDKVRNKVIEKLKSKKAKSEALFNELSVKSYDELVDYVSDKNNLSIDSSFRAEILREVLRYIDEMKSMGKILSTFYNDPDEAGHPSCLVKLRNNYAHKTALEIADGHNDEQCKYIRTETRLQLNNTKAILGEL